MFRRCLTKLRKPEFNTGMAKAIKSIEELVDALGGTSKMAALLGVTPPNVSMWIADNHIPRGHHHILFLAAWNRKLVIDPSVFGLRDQFSAIHRVAMKSPGRRILPATA